MTDLTRPLLAGFNTAHFALSLQLSDLSNEDALRRTRDGAGASISWTVGHLLNSRCTVLKACGVDQDNPYEKKFSFQSPASAGNDYPDISELRRAWNELHDKLIETVSKLAEQELLADTKMPTPAQDRTLLGGITFLMWHEAYHVGAVGLMRVTWGYRHTHELAMEAMKANR